MGDRLQWEAFFNGSVLKCEGFVTRIIDYDRFIATGEAVPGGWRVVKELQITNPTIKWMDVPPYPVIRESKWLRFEILWVNGKKTPSYKVFNKDGSYLTTVQFWPAWRKFVMNGAVAVIYDADCLNDVVEFLGQLTTIWRESLKK